MPEEAYNSNDVEDVSSFDFNDEAWQPGTSSSGSEVYSPHGSEHQSDAMMRWEGSYQNLIPFDYGAWQFEGTMSDLDMANREERSSVPLSVWEASAQSMGNTIPRSAQNVPEDLGAYIKPSSAPSYKQLPADSPHVSAKKSPSTRKRLSESALDKRRSQNRESQRSFRERQKLHVVWLEDQVRGLKAKYNDLEREYVHLNFKHRALLERTGVTEEAYCSSETMESWSLAPVMGSFTGNNHIAL